MTICCVHPKDKKPFRVDLSGYFIHPNGALELRTAGMMGEVSVVGLYAPEEWSFIHAPGLPGWPCELDLEE